jgi:hypothetical protein
MEFIELQRLLRDAEADRVAEARRLAVLVRTCPRFWWTLVCLHLRDPLGFAHRWRPPGSSAHHPGASAGGLRLRPRPLGLGADRLLSLPPSPVLHWHFVFSFDVI